MTNVSTKYLEEYIGYFTYLNSWKVDHKNKAFSCKDAEALLIEILKSQATYTVTDIKNAELKLPKLSPRYMTLLKAKTEEARIVTNNQYFKFDEEDNVVNFDKRKYLSNLPESKLKQVCKAYGIKYQKKWVKWSNITQLLSHPEINRIVIELIDQDKSIKITQEDKEFLEKEQYKHNPTA